MAGPIDPDWRDGAAYDYVDLLTHEQHAFEYLRRNPDYAADYRRMKAEADAGRPEMAERMAAAWGLRFPGGPEPLLHPRRHLAAAPQPTPCAAHEHSADPC